MTFSKETVPRQSLCNLLRLIVAVQFAVVLSACIPALRQASIDPYRVQREAMQQREAVLDLEMRRLVRLKSLSYSLRRAAVGLCKEHEKGLGLEVHDGSDYPKEYGEVAEALYHFGKTVKVYYVHPDTPAAEVGIRQGDTIIAIDGQLLQRAKDWKKRMREVADKKDTVVLTINNSMAQRDISIPFVSFVLYDALLPKDRLKVRAYADGDSIYISSAMLDLLKSDEELAFLISHELAHNCLRHVAKKRWGWLLWSTFDTFVHGWKGAEMEADHLGIYIMARAGYNITKAQQFLRHMATIFPANIRPSFTNRHPGTPERVLALEKTTDEIQRKVAVGGPLLP